MVVHVGSAPPQPGFSAVRPFDPTAWFPPVDALDPAGNASVRTLYELAFSQRFLPSPEAQDELVALADQLEQKGILKWDGSGMALLQVEVERIRAHRQWGLALEAGEDRPLQFTRMLEAASELAAVGEAPVADLAWLYVLEAHGVSTADTWDPDTVTDVALDLVMDRRSDAVVTEAALRLGAAGVAESDPVELRRILSLYDTTLSADSSFAVSSFGLRAAQEQDDGPMVVAFAERYEDSIEVACGDPSMDASSWCHEARQHLVALDGYLAYRGWDRVSTWEGALALIVLECATGHEREPSVASGSWNGDRWTWHTWEPVSELAACVKAAPPPEVVPTGPTIVELQIVVVDGSGGER